MRRLKSISVIAAILAMGIIPSTASAMTIGNAGRAAANWQKNVCSTANFVCPNPAYKWPTCTNTGVNQRNETQWVCKGESLQFGIYNGDYHACSEQSNWDPYGKLVYSHANYSCYYL